MKKTRIFFAAAFFVLCLAATPVSLALAFKSSAVSFLKTPLDLSGRLAQTALDLFYFRKNAGENKKLTAELSELRLRNIYSEEITRENQRLTRLLSLRQAVPAGFRKIIVCRVVARSSFAWNRSFLIDKGTRQGLRANMLVLSNHALVGKVVEAGPSVSRVLVISDPGFRMGVLVQRTRDQGMLTGASSGRCRIKYLSVGTELKKGDLVETAGFGHYFLKAIPAGIIERSWKEPGQIYQVAEMRPLADLNRLEEITCVE